MIPLPYKHMTYHLRLSVARHALLSEYASAYRLSKAEIIGRALRSYRRCRLNGVAASDFLETATRAESSVITIDRIEDYLIADLSGKEIAAVVGWYLDKHPIRPASEPIDAKCVAEMQKIQQQHAEVEARAARTAAMATIKEMDRAEVTA